MPYELLNKRYRLTQRFIERDGATLKAHAGALVNLPGRDAQKARLVEIRELLLSMREKVSEQPLLRWLAGDKRNIRV